VNTQVNSGVRYEIISKGRKPLLNKSELEYFKYKSYVDHRSSKSEKVLSRDRSQVKPRGQGKDHLKINKPISKKMSTISFFTQNKEKRLNFRKTLRKNIVFNGCINDEFILNLKI
jgi:hypothetical protein